MCVLVKFFTMFKVGNITYRKAVRNYLCVF
jgi:hypothetical protein